MYDMLFAHFGCWARDKWNGGNVAEFDLSCKMFFLTDNIDIFHHFFSIQNTILHTKHLFTLSNDLTIDGYNRPERNVCLQMLCSSVTTEKIFFAFPQKLLTVPP